MTAQTHEPASHQVVEDWDLDVSIIESGPEADRIIRMTEDACTTTCQSACTSC